VTQIFSHGSLVVLVSFNILIPVTLEREINVKEGHTDLVTCGAFSEDGSLFVSVADDKKLILWDALNWTMISTLTVVKKATCVMIVNGNVVWCDKFGSVYSIPCDKISDDHVENGKNKNYKLLLGHYSWITAMGIYDGYIFTGDKDNKIRVSRFPQSYDIHGYCFGHSQFVSCLLIPEKNNWIISGGGDGTMRLYDYNSCEELQSIFVCDEEYSIVYSIKYDGVNILAVIIEGKKLIQLYSLNQSLPYFSLISNIELPDFPYSIEFVKDSFWISQSNQILELKKYKWQISNQSFTIKSTIIKYHGRKFFRRIKK